MIALYEFNFVLVVARMANLHSAALHANFIYSSRLTSSHGIIYTNYSTEISYIPMDNNRTSNIPLSTKVIYYVSVD